MSKHSSIPYISSKIVDFQSTEIIGRAKLSNLIKLHGKDTNVFNIELFCLTYIEIKARTLENILSDHYHHYQIYFNPFKNKFIKREHSCKILYTNAKLKGNISLVSTA